MPASGCPSQPPWHPISGCDRQDRGVRLTIGSGGFGGREVRPARSAPASPRSWHGSWTSARLRPASLLYRHGSVGAIFGAPLGGAVLATEILYRDDFDAAALPSFVASLVGYVIFGSAVGFTPLFGFAGSYHFSDPTHLVWFALIGVLGGLIGLLYAKGFYGISDLFGLLALPRWSSQPSAVSSWDSLPWRSQNARHGYGWIQEGLGISFSSAALDRPRAAVRGSWHRPVNRLWRFRGNLRPRNGHRRVHRARSGGSLSPWSHLWAITLLPT